MEDGAAEHAEKYTKWGDAEEAMFYIAMGKYSSSTQKWDKVASMMLTRTAAEVKQHYEELKNDLRRTREHK